MLSTGWAFCRTSRARGAESSSRQRAANNDTLVQTFYRACLARDDEDSEVFAGFDDVTAEAAQIEDAAARDDTRRSPSSDVSPNTITNSQTSPRRSSAWNKDGDPSNTTAGEALRARAEGDRAHAAESGSLQPGRDGVCGQRQGEAGGWRTSQGWQTALEAGPTASTREKRGRRPGSRGRT